MSSDYKPVKVIDDRLCCTDSLGFQIFRGATDVTCSQFQAITQSTSNHVYNIQMPSLTTVCARTVLNQSTVCIKLQGVPPAGKYLIDYGNTDALCPFPLNNCFSNTQCQLNSTTTSSNLKDILPSLLRAIDKRDLMAYDSMTPVLCDNLLYYRDGIDTNVNVLSGFNNSIDMEYTPRGAFPVLIGSGQDLNGNPTGALVLGDGAAVRTAYVQFTVSEPLIGLSPWCFGRSQSNVQGIYGIANMVFTFNVQPPNRVWRTANNYITSVQYAENNPFQNSQLLFTFLTPSPSESLMPKRNVVPYAEWIAYNSPYNSSVPLPSGSSATLVTATIPLNQIPERIWLVPRKPNATLTAQDTDSCMKINNINIQFNNQSGLVSSATPQDLFRMSKDAQYNGSYYEWNGQAMRSSNLGAPITMRTSGSFTILEFGKHIQCGASYYAPGSLGNFTIQVKVNVTNLYDEAFAPEMALIVQNVGLYVIESGTSQVYSGILLRDQVLDVDKQQGIPASEMKRLVGGSFWDSLKSVVGQVLPIAKVVSGLIPHPGAQMANKVIGSLGYGHSGGGSSGGGSSGGALAKRTYKKTNKKDM